MSILAIDEGSASEGSGSAQFSMCRPVAKASVHVSIHCKGRVSESIPCTGKAPFNGGEPSSAAMLISRVFEAAVADCLLFPEKVTPLNRQVCFTQIIPRANIIVSFVDILTDRL